MALEPLAGVADLRARRIDTTDADRTQTLLTAASASIRDAAGCSITRATSTVRLWTEASRRIELPARPVHTVTAVVLDDVPVTNYKLRGSSLWRDTYWQHPGAIPAELVVTFDHGWDDVPQDIVDLCCSLVAAGLAAAANESGAYNPGRGIAYERVDDYQYGKTQGQDEIISPMELPERTRQALRTRFGTVGAVVGTVR